MATPFRADNLGSLLRPAELLEARAALRDGRMDEKQVREVEDRSILTALEMQKSAGVEIFTDGEYRRDIFTADITKAMNGLVPVGGAVAPVGPVAPVDPVGPVGPGLTGSLVSAL